MVDQPKPGQTPLAPEVAKQTDKTVEAKPTVAGAIVTPPPPEKQKL